MKTMLAAVGLAVISLSTSAHAEGFGVGMRLSTLGVGIEASQPLSPSFGLRFGISGLAYDVEFEYDDVDYDVEQSLVVPAVFLDWRPMQGRFRLTLGAAYYNNVSRLLATPFVGDTYEIGNSAYTGGQIGTLVGKITNHTGAPYLGVGWDFLLHPKQNKGLGFNIDVGALYTDHPDVSLSTTGGVVTASDLRIEEENIQDDAGKAHLVVSLGMFYRF
jgi:hypothetical protein